MTLVHFGESPAVEPGTIIMWSGALADIPAGWVICDGNNGTPNLLDRFAKQVPDGVTDPGATGGAVSQSMSSAQMPAHNHTGYTGSQGDHVHNYYGTNNYAIFYGDGSGDSNGDIDQSMTADGSHTHNLSSSTSDATGSGSTWENRPAYYEVAFIMKT